MASKKLTWVRRNESRQHHVRSSSREQHTSILDSESEHVYLTLGGTARTTHIQDENFAKPSLAARRHSVADSKPVHAPVAAFDISLHSRSSASENSSNDTQAAHANLEEIRNALLSNASTLLQACASMMKQVAHVTTNP